MQEVLPITAGVIIGLLIRKIPSIRLRMAALALLCTLFGALASYISGELSISWGFLTLDAALVWLGAVMAVAVVSIRRRGTRISADR